MRSRRQTICAAFPYESHFVEVRGSRMHYIDRGKGEPILFLHGNPTSSYLWRNVIPHVNALGRCIAPDLIGMGRSDKPDIGYRFADHAGYVEGFIQALGLRNMTLVIHDWGPHSVSTTHAVTPAACGPSHLWRQITRPSKWRELALITRWIWRRFRDPIKGQRMIIGENFFVERVLPMMAGRRLTEEEMENYRAPYKDPASRKPLLVWPREIPFDGAPADTHERISAYAAWLRASPVPKLLLWVKPGLIIPPREAARLRRELPNLQDVYLGKGKHFIQEQYPQEIGTHIANWYRGLP